MNWEESDIEDLAPSKVIETPQHTSDDDTESENTISQDLNGKPQRILGFKTDPDGRAEYLVKLHGRSFRDCEWITENELDNDMRTKKMLKKFHKIYFSGSPQPPYFDQSYLEPYHIITSRNINGNLEYLVQWKGLDYNDATWELASSIENEEIISAFKKREKIPKNNYFVPPPHPDPVTFKPLTTHVKSKRGLTVRPYQLEGLNFMANSWYQHRNAILADEMGLGKTLQTSIFLDYLQVEQGINGPFLVVVPLSTIEHWHREINEWTKLKVLMYCGIKQRRELIMKHEFFHEHSSAPKFNVLLTTYEYITKEAELFSAIEWRCIVCDEAHRLKNFESKLMSTIKTFSSDFKLLLTGTPLQNNIDELWTLLNYLDVDKFDSLSDFQEKFGDLGEANQIMELQNILKPLMLRRLKSDVEKSLAPLEEIIIECPMTPHQHAYYKSVYDKNLEYLTRGAHSGTTTSLRNITMELRKVCNHPYLIQNAEAQILIERRENAHLPEGVEATKDFINDSLIRSAGKMILLDKLLTKLYTDGHRVLIFSQMTKMLDIISDFLYIKGYRFERLDGSIRGDLRQAAIDRYNAEGSEDFVFLLCTKAGGQGINLTSADTVIIYDSDWNPQNDIQATARCHRIGQKKLVKAYRFITSNSYEKKMFERASLKLGLDHAVLESGKTERNQEEMEKLLRLGAYYAFEEENNDESEKFKEEDIESVLSRSMTIRHENVAGGEGSTFSKAQFELDETEDAELMAPDFWQKYLPDVVEDDTYEGISIAHRRRLQREEKETNMPLDPEELKKFKREITFSWSKTKINKLQMMLHRFGWGRWRKIEEVGDIGCSVEKLKKVSHLMLRWLLESCEEKSPVMEAIYLKGTNPEQSAFEERFTLKHKAEFEEIVTNGSSWKLNRMELMHFLNTAVQTCSNPPEDLFVPDSQTMKPAEWWSKEDDRTLLYGTWEHGLLQYENIKFSQPIDQINTKNLTNRLRSLINNLKSLYIKLKQVKGEEVQFNNDNLIEAANTWTKTEQRNAVHALCIFGYPGPEEFSRRAEINKSLENVDKYVKNIIECCDKFKNKETYNEDDFVEKIAPGTMLRISQRVSLLNKVRAIQNEPRFSETDRELMKIVSERGLDDLSDCPYIVKRFGESDTYEGKIVKVLKGLVKNKKEVQPQTWVIPSYLLKNGGTATLPLKINAFISILELGKVVVDRALFHNERYIFPAGFISRRKFASLENPDEKIFYKSLILDRGGDAPVFRVEKDDDPSVFFEGPSPTSAWTALLKVIEEKKAEKGHKSNKVPAISGPEYFGLTQAATYYLLQQLEGVDQLYKYQKKIFTNKAKDEDKATSDDDACSPKIFKISRSRSRPKAQLTFNFCNLLKTRTQPKIADVELNCHDLMKRNALDIAFAFDGSIETAIRRMADHINPDG